jgi:hypothetical protein
LREVVLRGARTWGGGERLRRAAGQVAGTLEKRQLLSAWGSAETPKQWNIDWGDQTQSVHVAETANAANVTSIIYHSVNGRTGNTGDAFNRRYGTMTDVTFSASWYWQVQATRKGMHNYVLSGTYGPGPGDTEFADNEPIWGAVVKSRAADKWTAS